MTLPPNSYLSDNFKSNILYGKPKKAKPVEVSKNILPRWMTDSEIQASYPGIFERDVFLATVNKLIEQNQLLTNGYANIFHVKGDDGRTLAVDVRWSGSEWEFYCYGFGEYGGWREGDCAFSPATTLSSDTSLPEISTIYSDIRKLKADMEKLKKIINLDTL